MVDNIIRNFSAVRMSTERKDGKGKHLHLSVYNTEDYDNIWNNAKKVFNFKTNEFLCNPFNHIQNYYKD